MKRYRLQIVPDVYGQIDAQMAFIARDSIDQALAWESRVTTAFHKIADLPAHAVDEAAQEILKKPYRRVVFESNYLIHYLVDEQSGVVRIMHLRHVARLPDRGEP